MTVKHLGERYVRPTIFLALAISFLPTLPLYYLLNLVLSEAPKEPVPTAFQSFLIIIVSPIVETGALGGMLLAMRKLLKNEFLLSLFSGALWALFHGLFLARWGIVVFWPFVVFSYSFLIWSHNSLAEAFLKSGCLHILYNSAGLAALLLLTSR